MRGDEALRRPLLGEKRRGAFFNLAAEADFQLVFLVNVPSIVFPEPGPLELKPPVSVKTKSLLVPLVLKDRPMEFLAVVYVMLMLLPAIVMVAVWLVHPVTVTTAA